MKIKFLLGILGIISMMICSCGDGVRTTGLWIYPIKIDSTAKVYTQVAGIALYQDSGLLVGASSWDDDMENYHVVEYEQQASLYISKNHGKKFIKKQMGKGWFSNFAAIKNDIYTAFNALIPNESQETRRAVFIHSNDGGNTWDTLGHFKNNITEIKAFNSDTFAFVVSSNTGDELFYTADRFQSWKSVASYWQIKNITLCNGSLHFIANQTITQHKTDVRHMQYELKSETQQAISYPGAFEPICFLLTNNSNLYTVGIIHENLFLYEAEKQPWSKGHFSPIANSAISNPFQLYIEKNKLYIMGDNTALSKDLISNNDWWETNVWPGDGAGGLHIQNAQHVAGFSGNSNKPVVYVMRKP